jgi:hypothetical protein
MLGVGMPRTDQLASEGLRLTQFESLITFIWRRDRRGALAAVAHLPEAIRVIGGQSFDGRCRRISDGRPRPIYKQVLTSPASRKRNRPMVRRWRYLTFFVLVIIGALCAVAGIFWMAPSIGMRDFGYGGKEAGKEAAKAIAEARTALLQVLAGVGGAIGLFVTWRSYLAALENRISENFVKAVEQLGSGHPEVKIGGILGIGRLLRTAKITAVQRYGIARTSSRLSMPARAAR